MKAIFSFLIGLTLTYFIVDHIKKIEYQRGFTDGYQSRINYEHGI